MNLQPKKGAFIVIDGGDGAGTTTIAKAVVDELGARAIYTREPGGSPYAEHIRSLILSDNATHADAETLFALFWAARRDHIMQTVVPALNDDKIVVSDRFDSSTYAYQIYAQGNSQLTDLFWSIREVFLGAYTPDMYILLDVDAETGALRTQKRGDTLNHLDKRATDFHKRVRRGLKEFVTQKVDNGIVIDASGSIDEVLQDVLSEMDKQVK